jgi:muramidase (phage lysozyme)
MELRFIVGMLIVSIGFALMLPAEKPLQKDNDNARFNDYVSSPIKVQQQRAPMTARSYARSMVSDKEYEALHELIDRESKWDSDAQNPKSTAYGLAQFVDKTWDLVEIEKSADYRIQLIAAQKYVMMRYGSWVKALEHHKQYGWY